MSGWGAWYRVVKTIGGRRYVYDQTTRRDGRRVLTLNRYIGPLGGYRVRGSLVGGRPQDDAIWHGTKQAIGSEAEQRLTRAGALLAAGDGDSVDMTTVVRQSTTVFVVEVRKAMDGQDAHATVRLGEFASRFKAQQFMDDIEAVLRQRKQDGPEARAATRAPPARFGTSATWTVAREQQFLRDVFDPHKAVKWQKPWSRRYTARPLFAPDKRLFELTRNLGVAGVTRAFARSPKDTFIGSEDGAWFSPSRNRVQVPDPSRFVSEGEFNRVMLHELAHVAVGRIGGRRDRPGFAGTTGYAAEEICVQLAADIAAGRLGLAAGHLGQSAAYVQGYRGRLKDDHDAGLAWAQRTAQKVVEHLVAHWPAVNTSSPEARKEDGPEARGHAEPEACAATTAPVGDSQK